MLTTKLFGTKIEIKPVFFGNVVGLWLIATAYGMYRHPGRDVGTGLLIGFGAMFLALFADVGHALAHIFSARIAKAPMDKLLLSGGMPRTLYFYNKVSPATHRMRSYGGPVFSALGLTISLLLFFSLPDGSVGHELAGWSLFGHGFIATGILMPLPIVDGGTILKWALVGRGKTEKQAEAVVQTVNWGVAVLAGAAGVTLLIMETWILGAVLLVVAVFCAAAGMGKIK